MKKLLFAAALAVPLVATSAQAVVVSGQIDWLSGQPVGEVMNWSGDIASTVDHIYFSVNTAGTISMDVLSWEGDGVDVNGDGESAFFDPYIYLFADDGSLDVGDVITDNDDSGSTYGDGSTSSLDSYLSLGLGTGDYMLAIGEFYISAADAVAGLNPGTGDGYGPLSHDGSLFYVADHGDYEVTFGGDITLRDPPPTVPEPSTALLLGLGMLGAGLIRRKRRS